jgi:predicted TIM-barrel fold metal-dependent hydrolase
LASEQRVGCNATAQVTGPTVGKSSLLELFGPHRLIFGGDWPALTTRRDCATWWGWAHRLTAALSKLEQEAIFDGNARAFCRLVGKSEGSAARPA